MFGSHKNLKSLHDSVLYSRKLSKFVLVEVYKKQKQVEYRSKLSPGNLFLYWVINFPSKSIKSSDKNDVKKFSSGINIFFTMKQPKIFCLTINK